MEISPQLNLVAEVITANGIYSAWDSIIFERSYGTGVSHVTLTCAEPGANNLGLSNQQLAIFQTASVRFAGQLVMNSGHIDLRRVFYNKESHQVQIRVASNTAHSEASTVDPKIDGVGGQYINQTFLSIAQDIMQKIKVRVIVEGSPSNADLPFPSVSTKNGEARIAFVNNLASQRDLHVRDNSDGYLVYGRPGETLQYSGLSFVEGRNILEARSIESSDPLVPQIAVDTNQRGNDSINGPDAAAVQAIAYDPNYKGPPRPFNLQMESTGSIPEAQLRANHEMSLNKLMEFNVVVTVQGWLTPDGNLWSDYIGWHVSLFSPMIIPGGSLTPFMPVKNLPVLGTTPAQANAGFGGLPAGDSSQSNIAPGSFHSPANALLSPPTPATAQPGTTIQGSIFEGLLIKGVRLLQDNEGGTRSEITLCLRQCLGAASQISPQALNTPPTAAPTSPQANITPGTFISPPGPLFGH